MLARTAVTSATRLLALVAVPLLAALTVHYSLTLLCGWGIGLSFFFALAVGVLLHFGATRLYAYHFPGEEEDETRLPAPKGGRFWGSLFALYLFSGVGAGVAWVSFRGLPLCHVLTLGAGALTYRLVFPLFAPGNVPRRGSGRNTSQGARGRGEARLQAGEILPFDQATEGKEGVPDFVPRPVEHRQRPWSKDDLGRLGIKVNGAEGKQAEGWLQELRRVGNVPNAEEAADDGSPAAKQRQAKKSRLKAWRVK
jgi:hypothetical protein